MSVKVNLQYVCLLYTWELFSGIKGMAVEHTKIELVQQKNQSLNVQSSCNHRFAQNLGFKLSHSEHWGCLKPLGWSLVCLLFCRATLVQLSMMPLLPFLATQGKRKGKQAAIQFKSCLCIMPLLCLSSFWKAWFVSDTNLQSKSAEPLRTAAINVFDM